MSNPDNVPPTEATEITAGTSDQPKGWRAFLPIHPAAELFPLMSKDELRGFADDIKNGLREEISIYHDQELGACVLDGRNRLDALELLDWNAGGRGYTPPSERQQLSTGLYEWVGDERNFDPYAYVLSKNVHRRHLTAEQKRDLIAKVLKAKPEASNLQVAKQVKADDKTVAKVRTELEGRSEIPNVKARTDTRGRKQPAQKKVSAAEREERERERMERLRAHRLEDYPKTIKHVCGSIGYISPTCDDEMGVEIPPSLTAETAAGLRPHLRAAIENLKKLDAALAEIERGGAVLQ